MFLFRLHQRIIYIVILTQVYFRMHLNVKSNVILSFHTLCSMFSQENLLYMIDDCGYKWKSKLLNIWCQHAFYLLKVKTTYFYCLWHDCHFFFNVICWIWKLQLKSKHYKHIQFLGVNYLQSNFIIWFYLFYVLEPIICSKYQR